jgi:hypothetical protein
MIGALTRLNIWSPTLFTVLRTAHHNALLLFPDGTHGVYLQADVHEVYRRLGRQRYTRPDPATLPARKTKAQRLTNSDSHGSEWQRRQAMQQIEQRGLKHQLMLEITDPPAPPVPTDDRVSSSTQDPPPTPPSVYPLVPRAAWMLEGDSQSDAEANADWRRAMERLLPSSLPPPLPAWRQAQVNALSTPHTPPPPWPAPAWGSNPNPEPSHEPD